MIEKMKFISITGPKADIDRVVNEFLSKYEIQLENALTELKDSRELFPYVELNPYKEQLDIVQSLKAEIIDAGKIVPKEMKIQDVQSSLASWQSTYEEMKQRQTTLANEHKKIQDVLKVIYPFRNVQHSLDSLIAFEYVKIRFGRIEKHYFQKFEKYILENPETIFCKADEDEKYIYGIYFTPVSMAKKITAVYAAMHFDPIRLPKEYSGTMKEVYDQLCVKEAKLTGEITGVTAELNAFMAHKAPCILGCEEILTKYSNNFDVRKMAACTRTETDPSYIICGWMSEKDAAACKEAIHDDPDIYFIIEDELQEEMQKQPPTKLKNPKVFKPFEMYVKMYGLPAYNEMDPTWFVAITYSFIFGVMFGDVGQGLLLCIGGFLLYRIKKMDLAGIIGCAGIFSTIFGFMFGSIFGFEDIIEPLWLRPKEAMMQVPLVGRLNTVFVVAIGFGMMIILICMVFNVLNARRAGDVEKTWFDTNAVAGLVFYGAATVCIFLLVAGKKLPAAGVLMIFFILPLIVIFLKEPLTNIVKHKAEILPEEKGMFFAQGFFEMFEVLLSYFSNTLSFVRIGAFAVSHAAMMEVVLMLAGAESGSPNIVVVVLGNLFVCGLEGLIVGIQVLRLEYYEIFSRFYKGNGRTFTPFGSQNK